MTAYGVSDDKLGDRRQSAECLGVERPIRPSPMTPIRMAGPSSVRSTR